MPTPTSRTDVKDATTMATGPGKSLRVVQRDGFFDDSFFTEAWDDFDRALQSVLDRFDSRGLKVDVGSRNQCRDVYSKIRSSKIDEDLYASQALQVTEKDGKFQAVMDVKDFNPRELQVRAVDDRIVVEGSYQKVAEDGVSSSCKSFYKEFTLPPAADMDQVSTALSKDGVLTIKAPKKEGAALTEGPRNTSSSTSSSTVQQSFNDNNSTSSFKSTSSRKVIQSSSSFESSSTDGFDSLPKEMREKLMFCDSGFGSTKTSTCSSPAPSEAGSESSRVSSTMEFDLSKRAPVKTEVAFNVSKPSQVVPPQQASPHQAQQPQQVHHQFQQNPPQMPPSMFQQMPQFQQSPQFQQQHPSPPQFEQTPPHFQQSPQPQFQQQPPPPPQFAQSPPPQFQQSPPPQFQQSPPQPQYQPPPPQFQQSPPPPPPQFQQSPPPPPPQFQQSPPPPPQFQQSPGFMAQQAPQQYSQFNPQPVPQTMATQAPPTGMGSGNQTSVSITEENGRRVMTSQTSNVVHEKDGYKERKETTAEITDKDSQAARREASTKLSKLEEDPEGKFKRAESSDAAEVSESCIQHLPDGSVMSVKKNSTSTSSVKQSFSSSTGGGMGSFFPPPSFPQGFDNFKNLMGRGHSLMSQMSTDSMGSTLSGRSGFSDMSNFSHFTDTSSPFSDMSNFSNMSSFSRPQQQQQQPTGMMPQDFASPRVKSFSTSSSSSSYHQSFSSNFGDGNF